MKDALAQPLPVVSIEIFHQPCNIVHSNGTSNLVCTDGTWSVETNGTLTSKAAAALHQLEDFRVATEHEADVEHVAFLALVRAEAAGTFSLKLAELPKDNERDAYARHVTFRTLELAGVASALALEEPLRHPRRAYRRLSQTASAFTEDQTMALVYSEIMIPDTSNVFRR